MSAIRHQGRSITERTLAYYSVERGGRPRPPARRKGPPLRTFRVVAVFVDSGADTLLLDAGYRRRSVQIAVMRKCTPPRARGVSMSRSCAGRVRCSSCRSIAGVFRFGCICRPPFRWFGFETSGASRLLSNALRDLLGRDAPDEHRSGATRGGAAISMQVEEVTAPAT
jgi:hypothetical protein